MHKNKLIVLISLILVTQWKILDARDFSYADSVPFLGIEDAAKQVKRAVCAVQVPGDQSNADKSDDWRMLGTGFLIYGSEKEVLGITCKHIVEASAKAKKDLYIGLDTQIGYRRFPCQIKYVHDSLDLAIVAPIKKYEEDVIVQNLFFRREDFDDGNSLIEGRSIIIPGYPLSLGVEDDRNHPVIRTGFIAQWSGKDYFLIDGIASHGNSGSPVFSLKYDSRKLVGMIISYVNDNILLYDENQNVRAGLPYNSGLARAITAKTILQVLDELERKRNP